ncbi:hypothetical protein THASP1DRAFT_27382 [Thamnocephalis sphaerospora]|uniref:Uncharacterized protein n=1 Tax=Thamnocephalis sphaerospora TaxID=78915 RepID=A0A4P9XWQ9_9FUNG|nr:hypothetical protein THASP1DRAFT_27382 [Thamnocephalis sphaerospora]|eukprot:RKP10843.1 hypothetical protein THASP1DRAFT_27382 [Thamnocephalis sphaerospora]
MASPFILPDGGDNDECAVLLMPRVQAEALTGWTLARACRHLREAASTAASGRSIDANDTARVLYVAHDSSRLSRWLARILEAPPTTIDEPPRPVEVPAPSTPSRRRQAPPPSTPTTPRHRLNVFTARTPQKSDNADENWAMEQSQSQQQDEAASRQEAWELDPLVSYRQLTAWLTSTSSDTVAMATCEDDSPARPVSLKPLLAQIQMRYPRTPEALTALLACVHADTAHAPTLIVIDRLSDWLLPSEEEYDVTTSAESNPDPVRLELAAKLMALAVSAIQSIGAATGKRCQLLVTDLLPLPPAYVGTRPSGDNAAVAADTTHTDPGDAPAPAPMQRATSHTGRRASLASIYKRWATRIYTFSIWPADDDAPHGSRTRALPPPLAPPAEIMWTGAIWRGQAEA